MKRLIQYLRGYAKESILGPLFKLIEASLELAVPLIIAYMIDSGIKAGDTSAISIGALVLLLLGALGLGFSVVAQYFSAKASVGVTSKLRRALFVHMQDFSYSDIDALGTSTMITRMTADTEKVQSGLNLALRLLLRSPFVVFGAMIMALSIDFDASVSFIAVIPLLSVVVFGIMLISMPLYKKVQGGIDRILLSTRENLAGARVIRAFRKEDDEIAKFKEQNDALTHTQKRVGWISALLNPLTYVIINLAIVWLIYSGALRVELGELSQGQVIALYNYMSQILVELIKLANLIISITKAIASAGRIERLLDTPHTSSFGEKTDFEECEYAVEFDKVSLTYNGGGAPSLDTISFGARVGETIGIIGGTGSGKTSLVNLIPGFYDATEGEVRIFGKEIHSYSEAGLREKIGVVPQKAVLFGGTVRENLAFGKGDACDSEMYRALDIAQATRVVEDKGGLDALIEQGGKNLSGGQRQRLTIARALVGAPKILILDDSASALDYATDASLRRAIRDMNGNTTTFIVSQRAASVMYADKIIVLDDGECVGMGTHDELLSSCSVYREIYDSQFKKEA
ncbi:MAG: ABC transporter ATP-binding protein [Clostridia bacterium]|nr:ABC transporter ATP-binding protein [Clostridia bacterium]